MKIPSFYPQSNNLNDAYQENDLEATGYFPMSNGGDDEDDYVPLLTRVFRSLKSSMKPRQNFLTTTNAQYEVQARENLGARLTNPATANVIRCNFNVCECVYTSFVIASFVGLIWKIASDF